VQGTDTVVPHLETLADRDDPEELGATQAMPSAVPD